MGGGGVGGETYGEPARWVHFVAAKVKDGGGGGLHKRVNNCLHGGQRRGRRWVQNVAAVIF